MKAVRKMSVCSKHEFMWLHTISYVMDGYVFLVTKVSDCIFYPVDSNNSGLLM